MANTIYQSPVINTGPKRDKAYKDLVILLEHINAQGIYGIEYVQSDFGITAAGKFTITLSGPIPSGAQLGRYQLTQI